MERKYAPTKGQWFSIAFNLAFLGGCAYTFRNHAALVVPAAIFARKFWKTLLHFRHGFRVTVTDAGIRVHGLRGEWIPWSAVRAIEIRHPGVAAWRAHRRFGEDGGHERRGERRRCGRWGRGGGVVQVRADRAVCPGCAGDGAGEPGA
jgi:hypothetical protein